jgi:hypothetical protein
MIAQVKRKPSLQADAMLVAMAVLVNAVRAQVATGGQVVQVTVLAIAAPVVTAVRDGISAKSGVRDWVMRLSAPSARRWSVPNCPCVNWLPKPMAKLSHA